MRRKPPEAWATSAGVMALTSQRARAGADIRSGMQHKQGSTVGVILPLPIYLSSQHFASVPPQQR